MAAWPVDVVLACILVISMTSLLVPNTGAEVLNEYIQDYQPLHFDHQALHDRHIRAKRSVNSKLVWEFQAYGRSFHLTLRPSQSVFSTSHVIEFGSQPPEPMDTSFIYEGKLRDNPSSSAHLSITRGGVRGHIVIPGDTTYHIEPSRNHFRNARFHTIIYPESKMNLDPFKDRRGSFCGSTYSKQHMNSSSSPSDHTHQASTGYKPHTIYGADSSNFHRRYKRQTGNLLNINQNVCYISMQADQVLYQHVLAKQTATGNTLKQQQAKEEIISIFASHVDFLNTLYETTEFHATNAPNTYVKGIRFQLQKSTVITECNTAPQQWESGYCTSNLDVSNFLEMTSTRNQDEFCLTYTFTYRDFLNGHLGLAYLGAPDSSAAGVCGRFSQTLQESGKVILQSQNTGVVTLVNFKKEVPLATSHLTMAHEVGHNFGAQHDPTESGTCSPYNTNLPTAAGGNYLMYPSSTGGAFSNNKLFSDCSKNSIFQVVASFKTRGQKHNCFKSPETSYCGNKIVEEGEECDCGFDTDCDDPCCVGRPQSGAGGCTFKPGAICNPINGPCCTETCGYQPNTYECRAESECSASASCSGSSAVCPSSGSKPDHQDFCENYSGICESGECIASVCKFIGWEECYKAKDDGATDSEMCYVSCLDPSTNTCVSTLTPNTNLQALLDTIKQRSQSAYGVNGLKRTPGSSCDAFRGYCDILNKCQAKDAEGPFIQLLGVLFGKSTWTKIGEWIKEYWWGFALICVGFLLLVALIIKFGSYSTPSQDPRLKPYQRSASAYTADVPRSSAGVQMAQSSNRTRRPLPVPNSRPPQPPSSRQNSYDYPYPSTRSSNSSSHDRSRSRNNNPHRGRPLPTPRGSSFDNYGYQPSAGDGHRGYRQNPPHYNHSNRREPSAPSRNSREFDNLDSYYHGRF